MWFICALLTTLIWGIADIFYKKGARENEKYSHLKICVFVGIIMGIQAIYVLLTKDINYNFMNIIYYFPVSMMYILSMALSFFGLRFIEDSIASPIENSSGAITAILCFFILGQRMNIISFVGVVLISVGVILLGVFESNGESKVRKKLGKRMTIIAFLMPVMYAIFDAMGEFLDAYYLDFSKSPLIGVTEDTIELVANTSYELTFFILAVLLIIFIKIKGEKIGLKGQQFKIGAGIFETIGQFTYVFAMSGNAIIAAPILSSVCVISVILARIFLKEELTKKQYGAVTSVIAGILILAVVESL